MGKCLSLIHIYWRPVPCQPRASHPYRRLKCPAQQSRSSCLLYTSGAAVTMQNGRRCVPDRPVIPFIIGDGTGPEIWAAASRVIDAAVKLSLIHI